MAIIAGARTFHQVRATVRAGFMPVMKVSWVTSPLALAFAQKFLPEHTWVPFFNIIGFFIGTYVNTHTKKKRLEALRKVCSNHQLSNAIETETHVTSSATTSVATADTKSATILKETLSHLQTISLRVRDIPRYLAELD